MTILERYIGRSFLAAALLAWLMLTFVLIVGLLMKVTTLVSRGMKPEIIGKYVLSGIPETLSITVPLAVLFSALLVFGRLSADSEIAAMRACGINLLKLMRGPLLAGLLLTSFCFYVQNEVAPASNLMRRQCANNVDASSGLAIFEPGRFIRDFNHIEIYFERKQGDFLHNIIITDARDAARSREVRAEKAEITQQGADIRLVFHQARVDPILADRPGAGTADRFTYVLTNAVRERVFSKKDKNLNLPELLEEIPKAKETLAAARASNRADPTPMNRTNVNKHKTRVRCLLFEIHRRAAFALTPLCFVFVGIPLGIRSHRRESTAGIGIALGVAFTFYLCQIAAEAAVRSPFLPYQALIWFPVVLCLGIACWLIPKNQ